MIEYLNPDASVGVEETPYELSLVMDEGETTPIGLLANGFPDSVEFLDELGAALCKLRPGIEVHAFNKGNATVPANEQLLGEIGGECVGVVAAYGH
ncbi:hypothetical protein EYC82_11140 [Halieaceae bacterium IMCC11814]|jgi:hypothetical protein|uniref:UGSC-like domain-containing protein n=2 Tax=Candidatus Marimicrobium litorale TaxID=2518991 RepID=A0ABT3T8W0_9GAMM|nr:hypothetical protein [Candidatus Marimicrobium litorale]MCX2977909.1 hypothetical protein [Candidatus Marimicrobium litorale]